MELTIGRLIQEERVRRGWDQDELALRLGGAVGQQAISRWEKGGSRPRRGMVVELAALFEADPGEFLHAAGYTLLADRPQISRPVRPRLTVLPVWELAPDKFEELVADIGQQLNPDALVTRLGSQGHKQHGVDVTAEKDSRYLATYQCKRHKEFGPQKVKAAVGEVTIEADAHFLVLSRRSASPAARKEMQRYPGWTLWDGEDISRTIRGLSLDKAVRIVDTFFPGWREPFLGVAEPGPWLPTDEFFLPLTAGLIYTHDWQLVGRADELADVLAFVDDPSQRIGLVVGRGGIGKSRLLLEVGRTLERRATSVRFAKLGSELRAQDYELLPRNEPLLLVIDDAHDRDDLQAMVAEVLRLAGHGKVLLALRPYGLDSLAAELGQLGLRVDDLPQFHLSDLSRQDAEALAAEALGAGWPHQLAERLGRLTADCPFITVVAGALIKRGDLDPACLDHEETIRKEVLRKFRDVVVANPVSGNSELRRAVLDSLGILQPFRSDDPAFQNSLGKLVDEPFDRAVRHLRALEDAGVLLRRGSSLRIVPDLLGDVVLSEACFDEGSGASTGFLERAWQSAEGEAAQHVFINASRIDWQIRHDVPGAPQLTDRLWDTVDEVAQSAGILGRISLLKLLQKVAYFEPRRSLILVRGVIDNPTDVLEENDEPWLWSVAPSYDDVVHELPGILQATAYNPEHLHESANLLWELAGTDVRETNPHPEHPLRVLQGLASLGAGKPLAYNISLVDLVEDWLKEPEGSGPSPFDVLGPMLATEGTEDSFDGRSIRFRPYLINPSVVRPLRERILNLAFTELVSPDIQRAARAAKLIEASLHYPHGLFGRQVSDSETEAWTPDFLDTFSRLKETLSGTQVDPVIAVAIEHALHWHYLYSKLGTRDAAREVLEGFSNSLGLRLAVALFDSWDQLVEGRTADFQEMEAERQGRLESLSAEIAETYSDEEIVDQLTTRLRAQLRAFGRVGNPNPLIWNLVKRRPSLGIAISSQLADDPSSVLFQVLAIVVAGVAELLPGHAAAAVQELLETDDLAVRRAMAQSLGWYRGSRSTLIDGEFEVLLRLSSDEDPFVRKSVVTAAQRLAPHHRSAAVALLTRVRFADSPEVAEEVFQSFSSLGPLRWSELAEPETAGILKQLIECPSIEPYWTMEFLSGLSKDNPAQLVTLLMERIDHWEHVEFALAYHPLPFEWHQPLQVRFHADFVAILKEVIEWLVEDPSSWMRHESGGRLFAAIANDFDTSVLSVLDGALRAASKAQMTALASILRRAPRSFIFENVEFVSRALDVASKLGQDCREQVASSMHGAVTSGTFTGTPGKPFAHDVEQRDKARAIANALSGGSVEERFYRSLEKSAVERIRWHAEHDDKLLDGRDW